MDVYEAVKSRRAVRGFKGCLQMAWSQVRETIAETLSPSDGLILSCGMSIGYEDPAVSYVRRGCAPLDETVTFVGGSLSMLSLWVAVARM